ncbi:MAG: RIP metalloprotease RseP [Candidatus Roizmanbacteria bacterium]|nr:MAG: RIP metalloprotease RseP [Candidatus Roizmanbacteria bacterium]
MSILIFLIILVVLVVVHELGHFIAAKKNGVLVEEFGFGLPPRLFGIKIGETLYSLNLLPIGGFVKLYGEEYSELKEKKPSEKNKNRAFSFKKPWQKALIVVAGITGNFILGWVLISFLFTQGIPMPEKTVVEKVQSNTPAEKAGLKPKDAIIKVVKDNKTYIINSSPNTDMGTIANRFAGENITMIVKRDNKEINLSITPRKNPPQGQGPLGITLSTNFKVVKYPWYQAPFHGLNYAVSTTKLIITELTRISVQFVTFQKPKVDVAGPVGIARYAKEAQKQGMNALIELTALLSLNLAVINILPFPALDGGRLVFILYEWITKKRVNQKFERSLNFIGIILLLTLAAIITVNDILKIYR